jgi:hypothetical protein
MADVSTRSGLSRKHVHGKVRPIEEQPSDRQVALRALAQLALLCGLFLVAVFGAAVLP